MRAFAFLDVEHPPVAWAVMRGVLVGADSLREPSSFVSFMFAGIIQSQNNRRLHNEIVIEHTRSQRFINAVSRLRGMYFFEDRATAQLAIDQDWGGHFKIENLAELDLHPSGNVSRVDANWITKAPRKSNGLLDTSNLNWIDDYWAGRPNGASPTWEVISRGYAIIPDVEFRKRAYEVVQRAFPRSWIFMEMSRIAGEAGSDGGLSMPYIIKRDAQRHTLGYLLDDQAFHDEAIINKMTKHPDIGRLGYRMSQEETWIVPDFRPWFSDFVFELQGAVEQQTPIFSVHAPNPPHLAHPTR
jgi:hypothetical protein